MKNLYLHLFNQYLTRYGSSKESLKKIDDILYVKESDLIKNIQDTFNDLNTKKVLESNLVTLDLPKQDIELQSEKEFIKMISKKDINSIKNDVVAIEDITNVMNDTYYKRFNKL